jgi:hypothetical protein
MRYGCRYTSATEPATRIADLSAYYCAIYRAGDGIRTHDVQLGKSANIPAEKAVACACKLTKRRFLGCEIDETNFRLGLRHFAEYAEADSTVTPS